MAQTPDSGSPNSYISAQEFLDRYDSNLVGQLVSDTGSPVTGSSLLTNTNLLAILNDASAQFELALLVGGRYHPSDILALLSQTGGNYNYIGASIIKRLISDLSYGFLRQRRGMIEDQPNPSYIQACKILNDLKNGEAILPFIESEQAGDTQQSSMNWMNYWQQGRISSVYARMWGMGPANFPNQQWY